MFDYEHLYLSPHLDDVVLSCGGQIFQHTAAGEKVHVVTVMAGWPAAGTVSDYAQFLHTTWGLRDDVPPGEAAAHMVQMRREEDVVALEQLGATYAHWPFPDCIYRQGSEGNSWLYTSDPAIFGDVNGAEEPLIEELATRLRELPSAQNVYCPMTVGHHVDHLLIRAAAKRAFGNTLSFYEDYPYVQRVPEQLNTLLAQDGPWQAETISLSQAAVRARVEAILAYRSQVDILFGNRQAVTEKIIEQVERSGGERLWRQIHVP